jgi:hypothetical protein
VRLFFTVGFWLFAGCASTSLAPSIIRFAPPSSSLDPVGVNLGLRTGPRLANVLQPNTGSVLGATNSGSSFDLRNNLGLMWDLDVVVRTRSPIAFHLGAQAEFGYPIPVPGFGLFAGVSAALTKGQLTVAPALAIRGATDFGLAGITGASGSYLAADVCVTLSVRALDDVRLALVPFFSVQQPASRVTLPFSLYAGGMVVARFGSIEAMAGFGRVFADAQSFNVPLMGLRAVLGN